MKAKHDIAERFVAFIDILGFKDLLGKIESELNSEELNNLVSALNFMDEETYDPNYSADLPVYEMSPCGSYMIEKELGDPRLTYISDCIIISAEPTLDGFKGLSRKIHKITADLALSGIFCRGAISKGLLYHHGRILFGSAYLKAYNLEEKVANFPRVIIDPEILGFFDLSPGQMPLGPIFYGCDTDGYYYQRYWTWYLFPPYAGRWENYLITVKQKIEACLQKFREVPKVHAKYQWLAHEFNSCLDFWAALTKGRFSVDELKIEYEEA